MLRTVLTHAQNRDWSRARPLAEQALTSGLHYAAPRQPVMSTLTRWVEQLGYPAAPSTQRSE
jgi:hypothetical protein